MSNNPVQIFTNPVEDKKKDFNFFLLNRGIWLYFFLLLFEGALRKWFLPFLAGPLVLVRDPIALAILFIAYKNGYVKFNFYVAITVFVGVLAIVTTLVFGHGNIGVCLFGARIILLHFPLIFVIGEVFDKTEVLRVGNVLLYISIPMTILMAMQFYSPQSAWVNRGLGGDTEGAGFAGALGFFRPPGTFSFISGLTQFYGILTCFVFYFWLKPSLVKRNLLVLATICVFAAIPFSISRTLLFQTIITLLFFLFVLALEPKNISKIFVGSIIAVFVLFILSNISVFKTPIEAFTTRFEGASEFEGGIQGTLVDRYLGSMFNSVSDDSESHFFGGGLGLATNAGSQLLSKFQGGGKWRENEWGRIILESGFLLGMAMIAIRVALSFNLTFLSFKKLYSGNALPWLLLSFCLPLLVNGQWAQPTGLGFATFVTGILVGAFNNTQIPKK